MRKILLSYLLCLMIGFTQTESHAAILPDAKDPVPVVSLLDRFASMNMKQVQLVLGRKFTLKEKIGFLLFKQKVRRAHKKGFENSSLFRQLQRVQKKGESSGSKGLTALVFGIVAIALLAGAFIVGFLIIPSLISAILAIVVGTVARHRDPKDVNAKIGKLLGWLTLGITAILFIAVAVALANIFN